MSLAAKLQLKPGAALAVVDPPEGVVLDLPVAADAGALLVFVAERSALDRHAAQIAASAAADRLTWVAWPKGKGTDLNRDTLNAALMSRGIRAVRNVAIDERWSALRFRPG